MRADAALTLHLRHGPRWRAIQYALFGCVIAAQLAWGWRWVSAGGLSDASAVLAGLGLVYALGLALRVHRGEPCRLHWDTQHWRLSEGRAAQARIGRLVMWQDWGDVMLLTFQPEGEPAPWWAAAHWHGSRRPRFLCLERSWVGADWHLVRSAVYCAQPAASQQFSLTTPRHD